MGVARGPVTAPLFRRALEDRDHRRAALGVHHETVRAALQQEMGGLRRGVSRPSALDPFLPFIRDTLTQYPRLRATRLHEMLRQRGYPGSAVQVRRLVRRLRVTSRLHAPVAWSRDLRAGRLTRQGHRSTGPGLPGGLLGSVLGCRSYRNTKAVINDVILRGRLVGVPLIATDGFDYFAGVIVRLFGPACIYGQVLKTRRNNRVVRVERRVKIGTASRLQHALLASEDSGTLNTSFVERLNLTIRQASAYLRRRSLCHARGADQLRGHVELLRCYYNFSGRTGRCGSGARPGRRRCRQVW